MAIKDRVIEIAYKLKDQFTAGTKKITRELKKVERETDRTADGIEKSNKRAAKSFGLLSSGATIATSALTAIGAAATAVLSAAINSFRKDADNLAKTSLKLGIQTQELQKLRFAGEQTGVAVNTLDMALQRMVRRVAEAAEGTGEAKAALRELGIDAVALAKLTPDQQFKKIADAMEEIPSQSDRVRLAFKLFDSEGVSLVNTLNGGSKALDEYGRQLEKTGAIISDKGVSDAQRFNEQLNILSHQIEGISTRLSEGLVSKLSNFMEALGYTPETKGLDQVRLRIAAINEELRDAATIDADELFGGLSSVFGSIFKASQIEKLKRELQDLNRELVVLERNEGLADEQRKKEARERAHQKELERITKQGTEALKDALSKRKSAYSQYVSDIKQLEDKEKQIAEDFVELNRLIASAGDGKSDGADFIDASKKRLDAETALNKGDYEEAVRLAGEGSAMIKQMISDGDNATVALKGLSAQLERVAKEAIGEQKSTSLISLQKDQQAITELEQKIANLPKAKLDLDASEFNAKLQELQQQVEGRVFRVTVALDPDKLLSGGYGDIKEILANEARKRGEP